MSKRRSYKPLTSMTGTPFFDQYKRGRQSQKRAFMQLTLGGKDIPPIPSPGRMYRTVKASTFADTEGISDTSWSTGVTGDYASAGTSYNCLYLHAVTPSLRNTPLTYNMQPIKWECDAPSALTGGSYDWWWKTADKSGGFAFPAPSASQVMCGHPLPETASELNAGAGAIGVIDTMMVANTHAAFTDDKLTLNHFGPRDTGSGGVLPTQVVKTFPLEWQESTLDAISSENRGSEFLVECNAIEHYINGVGQGLIENPAWPPRATSADWAISTISPGDSYYLHIWYKLRYAPVSSRLNVPGKMCSYIPTTRVSNGSRRTVDAGVDDGPASWRPMLTFFNVDYSPNFNRLLQSYQITIAGHTGWTLKDGSNGPHTMVSDPGGSGWTATVQSAQITFTPSASEQDNIKRITLSWGQEIASIEIEAGPVQLSAASQPTTDLWLWRYRPANSGDYATSTSSADLGTVTHSPTGVFTQDGTTTFSLCDASMIVPQYRPSDNYSIDTDGRTAGLIPSYPGVPTSITITRVDL